MKEQKIAIVGPGAMGCLFAGLLGRGGHEVWLVDKNPDRARQLQQSGITILRGQEKQNFRVRVTADPEEPGPARLVIICVKAYHTGPAAQRAAPLVAEDTDVLSLQNGIGNVETLVRIFGPERALGGTTAQGANLVGPGEVRHAGQGETVIGEPGGEGARARAVAELMNRAGINARVTDDLTGLIFSKLAINAAINPLTAILKVRNGALLELKPAREIMAQVSAELSLLCQKKNVKLLFEDPLAKAREVAKATAENISSMLADVRMKRRTEIDYINGAVAREAEALGIAAPVNQTLAGIVRAIEDSYDLKI